MKLQTTDLTRYKAMLAVLEGILQHRREHPTTPSDTLYYELLVRYYRRLLHAHDEGKQVVAYGIFIPMEILHCFNVAPLHTEMVAINMVNLLKSHEEAFGIAKSYGLPVEMCSAHRTTAAIHVQGWLPRPDFIVWSNTICFSMSKNGELIRSLWDVPGLFLERPYRNTPKDIAFFARELEELIAFLEKQTGQKMDWTRFFEIMEHSRRVVDLQREVHDLRKRVPSPGSNRSTVQFFVMDWLYGGTPEAASYYEAVRDEVKGLADSGRSLFPERFRLLSLCSPPSHNWKLVDWMQKEKGASLVADTFDTHWAGWEWDPSHPLESLAAKCAADPHILTYNGPVEDTVEAVVQDAVDFRVDGGIYWAAVGCRQGCGMVRVLKDALRQRANIPLAAIDMDVNDPTVFSDDELKDKVEGFLELLEERKG